MSMIHNKGRKEERKKERTADRKKEMDTGREKARKGEEKGKVNIIKLKDLSSNNAHSS